MFFLSKSGMSQAYRPMLQDSVRWIVVWNDVATPYSDDNRWEYFALGDTLLGDVTYKKIYHRFLESHEDKQPPFNPVSQYVLYGLMREDTLSRQVYGILLNSEVHYYSTCPPETESLMYDFSLSVGDTIDHFCTIPIGCGGVVINSTDVGNVFGVNTKWFELAGGCSWGYLYEGIGSSYGLWEALFTPVKSKTLWNLRLEYYCPDAVCPFIVGTKELNAIDRSLNIYPNPANNWVSFTYTLEGEQAQAVLELRDAAGKTVHQVQLSQPKGAYLWDTRELQSGTYYYILKTANTNKSGKVVISK